MTKNEVKAICEADDRLQWWAMVLFAEISELMSGGYREDKDAVHSYVRSKVEEFPRLVVQRAVEKAKPVGMEGGK